ncbi:exportin-1 [Nematocida sp. AWRm77]|nr:exportin-1 [Nematocida sp. AWRm77]
MEKVLESTEEFDVELFERIIESFYFPQHPEHRRAEEVLLKFRDHPDSWARAASIMKEGKDMRSKLFALQVLERMVRIRWSLLTEEQKESVREYVVETILQYAVEESSKPEGEQLLKRLNLILIEIIKREWPAKWPTLIPDLLAASKGECLVCKNTFELLGTLVDTIFNDPKNMVSKQIEHLQSQMAQEFPEIFMLAQMILEKVALGEISVPKELITSALFMLLRMLPHMPVSYTLETNIADVLCKYMETQFNTKVLRILRDVIERKTDGSKDEKTAGLFFGIVRKAFIHASAFAEKYFQEFERVHKKKLKENFAKVSDKDVVLLKELVLFFGAAYGHAVMLEKSECNTLSPLDAVLEISEVDDFELFRFCTEFWHKLIKDLYLEFPFSPAPAKQPPGLRRAKYAAVLPRIARVFVIQMSRPEEVIVREEEGELILEKLSETEHLAHCREMKETLFNISSLTSGGLSSFLIAEAQNLFGAGWAREKANKTAWAIGAVAESMSPENEREFLMKSLDVFIRLCDTKTEIVDRGTIASCILYIMSQNPKFLQTYWKFLKITTLKIFEFMAENYVGIPDMACETMLTIASKCGKEYRIVHEAQGRPLVEDLLEKIPELVASFGTKTYLLELVYEAFCYMVGSKVEELLKYTLHDVFSPDLSSVDGVQKCIQSIRRIKVVCQAKATSEFCASREASLKSIVGQLHKIYDTPQVVACTIVQLQRWMENLKRELLGLLCIIASEFSMEFIHGGFMEVCSQIVLSPLTSAREFLPGELHLLGALSKRTIDTTHALVDAVSPTIAKIVISHPDEKEELLKAFYGMLCVSVKAQLQPSAIEVVEWIAFGVGQPHREVSEECIEVIAYILNKGSIEMIRVGYFGLLECVVGAALDKDHEGGRNSLVEALSTLVRYSIEEKCSPQSEVLSVFGLRLHQTFPHLSSSDIEEFVYRCYENVNSHDELSKNIDDFQVKIHMV